MHHNPVFRTKYNITAYTNLLNLKKVHHSSWAAYSPGISKPVRLSIHDRHRGISPCSDLLCIAAYCLFFVVLAVNTFPQRVDLSLEGTYKCLFKGTNSVVP